jgi:hypothetical protein
MAFHQLINSLIVGLSLIGFTLAQGKKCDSVCFASSSFDKHSFELWGSYLAFSDVDYTVSWQGANPDHPVRLQWLFAEDASSPLAMVENTKWDIRD